MTDAAIPSESRPAAWGPLLVVAAVVLVGGAGLAFSIFSEPVLPEYGPIPAFSLEERAGGKVALNDLLGKVWVADFIFTKCAGVCPAMTHCMVKVQEEMKGDADARLVGVTSAGDVECTSWGEDARIDANRAFVEPALQALPRPASPVLDAAALCDATCATDDDCPS